MTRPLLPASCTDSLEYLDDKCNLKLFRMDVSTHTRLCACLMSSPIRRLSLDGRRSGNERGRVGWCLLAWAVPSGVRSGFIAGCRTPGITIWGLPSHLGACDWPQHCCCLHVSSSPQIKIINIFSFIRDYWHMWLTHIPVLHAWNVLSASLRSLLPHWPLYSAKKHFNLPHYWAAKWFLIWLVLLNGLPMLMGSIKSLGVSLKLF